MADYTLMARYAKHRKKQLHFAISHKMLDNLRVETYAPTTNYQSDKVTSKGNSKHMRNNKLLPLYASNKHPLLTLCKKLKPTSVQLHYAACRQRVLQQLYCIDRNSTNVSGCMQICSSNKLQLSEQQLRYAPPVNAALQLQQKWTPCPLCHQMTAF